MGYSSGGLCGGLTSSLQLFTKSVVGYQVLYTRMSGIELKMRGLSKPTS